jgi:hypothetical protein
MSFAIIQRMRFKNAVYRHCPFKGIGGPEKGAAVSFRRGISTAPPHKLLLAPRNSMSRTLSGTAFFTKTSLEIHIKFNFNLAADENPGFGMKKG